MSFKEKAVSWRQEVHIGKTKPRLIKAAILLLCFGVLIGMAWYYSEFSEKDCAILAGICVLTLAIYMIDMPVHPVIRILFALVIPLGCFYTFETLTHQMSTMIELAKRLNIAFYYWLFLFVFFIAGRTSISMAICVSAIAIIGVGNYFVVMFRSNPIVPWDIYSFETAMSVADNYVFSVDWALAEHIAMFILMLIVGVRTNIRLNKKILRPILTVAMCIPAYFYISYLWQDNLERNTGLNDLIRILLLRELIGRPGFPGFRPPRPPPPPPPRPPRPPMRPPMGPGPRPPRPRGDMSEYNRQYFDRFDDSCDLFEY